MKTKLKWALIVLITLGVGVGGFLKLIRVDFFVQNALRLNYTAEFSQFIGLLEVLGSIGLFFPKWRLWALLGLSIILVGAVGVSVGAGAGFEHHMGPVVPLLLCLLTICLDDTYQLSRKRLGV